MKPKEIKAIKEELDIIPEELVTNVEKETKDFWNLFWKLREYAYNYSNSIMIKKIKGDLLYCNGCTFNDNPKKFNDGSLVYKLKGSRYYYCEKCFMKTQLLSLKDFDLAVGKLRNKLIKERGVLKNHREKIQEHNVVEAI